MTATTATTSEEATVDAALAELLADHDPSTTDDVEFWGLNSTLGWLGCTFRPDWAVSVCHRPSKRW